MVEGTEKGNLFQLYANFRKKGGNDLVFKKAGITAQISELKNVDVSELGVYQKTTIKKRHYFNLEQSVEGIKHILNDTPINQNDVLKIISYSGGFASISFIDFFAKSETILELFASTLRVGKKQLATLCDLKSRGLIDKAGFLIGGIMKSDTNTKYDYYSNFINICTKNGWKYSVVNNHSKIILMRTKKNYYVLETSSNLNDNPKIEQFSLENNKELYNFYNTFFSEVINLDGS